MEIWKNFKNNMFNTQVGTATTVFGIAMIICALSLSGAIANIKRSNNVISVTGSAEKLVKSDTAKVTIEAKRRADNGGESTVFQSKALNNDADLIKNYLISKGFKADEIQLSTQGSADVCKYNPRVGYADCNYGIDGQDLWVAVIVNTSNVELANKVAGGFIGDMASKMQNVKVSSVEYFYNKLKDDRADMMSLATQNALERARAVARAGGSSLGAIREASTGVIQVTQVNSSDISDYGTYDTSTVDKKITAVVRVSFEVR